MSTNDTRAEISRIDEQLTTNKKDFSTSLAASIESYASTTASLMARKGTLMALSSVLTSDVSKEAVQAVEAAVQKTSAATQGTAPTERRKGGRPRKNPEAASAQASGTVTETAPARGKGGRRKGVTAKGATAKGVSAKGGRRNAARASGTENAATAATAAASAKIPVGKTIDSKDQILNILKEAGTPMKPGQLAERIGVSARGMGPVMQLLTKDGSVQRENDGRYQYVGGRGEAAGAQVAH